MSRFIALLRGINVGGSNKVPMARLRAVCPDLGWANVQTYIQSGNVVFDAAGPSAGHADDLAADLEAAIAEHFGLAIPVIVRAAADWPAYVAGNPFVDAAQAEPNRLMLALSARPPQPDAVAALRQRATAGERIEQVGDALYLHFPAGSGTSKLSPALLDRAVGSPVTMRNWRTVLKLDELLREPAGE